MSDYEAFRHGGVTYPLPASTASSLLRDADPALYFALEYLSAVLQLHLGARLTAQAALEGLTIASAVAQKLHSEPAPFLYADQLRFPTLAIYRKNETYTDKAVSFAHDAGEWEYAYILPPLTPRQIDKLGPILRSAAQIVRHAVDQGWHPAYNSGQKVWTDAGVSSIRVVGVRYGGYEPIAEISTYYRAIVGTMQVVEREMPYEEGFELFDGGAATIDGADADGTVVSDFVEVSSYEAPTITSITPTSGPSGGGTPITIAGTGFRVGTTPLVAIGGASCTNVAVVSPTAISAVTPPHAAYPTFVADVVVANADGQQAVLADGFTFT